MSPIKVNFDQTPCGGRIHSTTSNLVNKQTPNHFYNGQEFISFKSGPNFKGPGFF